MGAVGFNVLETLTEAPFCGWLGLVARVGAVMKATSYSQSIANLTPVLAFGVKHPESLRRPM
jgi:hypothetical protein